MPDDKRSAELAVLAALVRTAMQLDHSPSEAIDAIAPWIYEHRKQYLIGWARYKGVVHPEGFFQDFMGQLMEKWASFVQTGRPPEAFWNYLKKIYENALIADWQKRTSAPVAVDPDDTAVAAEPPLLTYIDLDALRDRKRVLAIILEEIVGLSETSRGIMELTFCDPPLPDKEIAKRLNIPENAVRARRFRAVDELRRRVYVRLSYLCPADVLNWSEFLLALRGGDSVLPRVRETFNGAVLEVLNSPVEAVTESHRQAIVEALNVVIDQPFFSADECLRVFGDALAARLCSSDDTSNVHHLRVNRLIFEHVFKSLIRESLWSTEELHDR